MARILVFDSGVGGLSVLAAVQQELLAQSPIQHQWIFCSDNAFFPYGIKNETELLVRVASVVQALYRHYEPDILIVACNTASTVALEQVRALLPCPIVGVVPAIKPAAGLSQSRVIGLLATPATISRAYTHKLISDFASDCEIISIGSSELVWMAEGYLLQKNPDTQKLRAILKPLHDAVIQKNIDTVVLACTHFPLLNQFLAEQLPSIAHWVDSGDAIARRVTWLLESLSVQQQSCTTHENQKAKISENIALFTRLDNNAFALRHALSQFQLYKLEELTI